MRLDRSLTFVAPEGVYAPAENSELLVESVDAAAGERALEVGTGSGFAAVHCALAGFEVVATDRNPAAAACARRNAAANGADVRVVACDLAGAVRGRFDVVLFNPPYLPGMMGQPAADGGEGGTQVVSGLLADLPRLLEPGGRCVIVLSSHSDAAGLMERFPSLAFQERRKRELFFEVLTSYEIRLT